MNRKFILFFIPLLLSFSALAAPPIISYSGQVSVDGQPYTGNGEFKFAFVDGQGQFSYWSHDGTSSAGSEPTGKVSVPVNAGLYSVMLGDTTLTGMSAISESIFANHNDVHLRIWFSDGQGFEQLTPDRRFASVPYSLGANGTSTANMVSTGSGSSAGDNNSSTTNIHNYNFGGPLGMGHARLVADGPEQPSTTLVLLAGDSAEVASYVADMPGRLEYAFDAYTIALPRGDDALLSEQSTLIGPGSVRLTAPTGVVNVAILKVNRASGRDPNKIQGSPAPDSAAPAPAPAIVSVPKTRSVARGGTTTLFVSASGDDLSYQWKKNGVDIAGATSAGLPLQNATGADEGNYTVVITNSQGSVTSDPIVVAVKMPAVPTGVYRINNSNGATGHEVALTGFSIDQHEVTKAFWDEVYAWAVNNGYSFTNAGIAEGPEHPVHSVNWYDCVKWANALSERDGHTPCYYTDNNCTQVYRTGEVDLTNYNVRWNVDGYRLPTESEWEVAARGGLEGSKYAWGESASTSKANFDQSLHGATLPVGSYPSTGYGLFEIGGNLREWTWDSNETNTDGNSSQNLVDDENSTAFFVPEVKGFQPFFGNAQSASQVTTVSSTDSTNWVVKKSIVFGLAIPVFEVRNEIKNENQYSTRQAECKIKFYYNDNTTAESSTEFRRETSWSEKTYPNPSTEKLVVKVDVLLRQTYNSSYYEAFERNTRIYRYPSNTNVGYLTLNIPPYILEEANATHFEVNIDATREAGDDIWFELVDGENNQTYANANFGSKLELPSNIQRPKKLRIYLNQAAENSTIGGTFVHAVYLTPSSDSPTRTFDQMTLFSVDWKSERNGPVDNPRGWWQSNQRVLRDNHYAEGLQVLSEKNLSSPANRYSTVGFRLVQRP
jgi:formylglycine-generating enzyme required for sulfatase activity